MAVQLGGGLYYLLSNDTNITGIVGTRIYPNVAPLRNAGGGTSTQFPYIVYTIISTETVDTKGTRANPNSDPFSVVGKDRRSKVDIVTAQISMYAADYGQAVILAANVRNCLDNTVASGTTLFANCVVDSLVFETENAEWEKDILPKGVHHIAQDYKARLINTQFAPAFANVYSTLFEGVDEYVDLGDAAIFSFGNGSTDSPFSISFWANFDSVANSDGIIGKEAGAGIREYQIRFGFSNLRMRLYNHNSSAHITKNLNNALSTGQWYHIVCTYDGSATADGIKIFVDGTTPSQGSTTVGTYTAMGNTAAPLTLGKSDTAYFKGHLDEVSLFNIELSDSQVLAIYNSGAPTDLTSHTGLIGWWRMGDSGAFPEINDNSSNSNDGSMENMLANDIENFVP